MSETVRLLGGVLSIGILVGWTALVVARFGYAGSHGTGRP
jgi:hypothetical protein